MLSLFVFALGAIVGSFLNVCIHRLPREESIIFPPSHCPRCGAPVKPYDNVPILSWLALRGRCRSCGGPISPRYLAVELLTALVFLGILLACAHAPGMLVVALIFASSLIVVVFVDLEHQIIPDEISLGGIAFGLAASLACPALQSSSVETPFLGDAISAVASWVPVLPAASARSLVSAAVGIAVGGGLFWLIRAVSGKIYGEEAMGFGDVKLMAYFGAILGPVLVLLTTFFASLIGSVTGLLLIGMKRAELKSKLPFGPFLCIGALIAFLWGERCIAWYLDLLR
ncbi:MAG: prepilin peptidase [Planctomycetota bacterium]